MSQDAGNIRALAVDDHPLLRAGIAALIVDDTDITLVGDRTQALSSAPERDTGGAYAHRIRLWRGGVRRHLILAVALHLAGTSLALAQTATGVIRGTVQDPSGAVVVDVQVTLVDEATDQRREQRTNEKGVFEFRTLPFGTYRIEAEQPGFKKVVIEDVALEVAQTAVVNIALQVGTVNESIGVRAEPVLLDTSDASLSQVIDDKRLEGLPLNGRNFMQLVSLSAGVINAGRASATQRQANYGPGFSVGGQRDNTSVVLVDGMEVSGQELNNYPWRSRPWTR
jgi:hypothetical protein